MDSLHISANCIYEVEMTVSYSERTFDQDDWKPVTETETKTISGKDLLIYIRNCLSDDRIYDFVYSSDTIVIGAFDPNTGWTEDVTINIKDWHYITKQ